MRPRKNRRISSTENMSPALQKLLAIFPDIARTHGDHNIAFFHHLAEILRYLLFVGNIMRVLVPEADGGVHNELARDPLDRLFSRRIHVRHNQHIRKQKGFSKFLVKIPGARVQMRLEHADNAATPSGLCPRQRGAAFGRMMGIVVVDRDSFELPLFFPSSVDAGEFLQAGLYLCERNVQLQPDRDRRERILNVLLPPNLDLYLAELGISSDDRKGRRIILVADVHRLYVTLWVQSVRDDLLFTELGHDVQQRRFIQTQHDKPVERHFIRELDESPFDVFQVAVAVKMVGFQRCDHRDRRRNGQEGPVEFVRLNDAELSLAQPCIRYAQTAQLSADDDRRVEIPFHQDQADHRGGGRLAMRSGNAYAVFQAHDFRQHLRTAHDRDLAAQGLPYLGVLRHDGRGIHYRIHIGRNVLGFVTLEDLRTELLQAFRDLRKGAVGAADLEPLVQQNLRNAAHTDAADADEV